MRKNVTSLPKLLLFPLTKPGENSYYFCNIDKWTETPHLTPLPPNYNDPPHIIVLLFTTDNFHHHCKQTLGNKSIPYDSMSYTSHWLWNNKYGKNWTLFAWFICLHSVCFIRNIYEQRFLRLDDFWKNLSNWLVVLLKKQATAKQL